MHLPSSTTALIFLLHLLPASASSPTRHPLPLALARRQTGDTCDSADDIRCPNVAAEYCCPSTAECIPLENATSVICCNKEEFCDEIHPIGCGETSVLEKCGSSCCPIGFECSGDKKKCLMKKENLPEKYREKQKADQSLKAENIELCREVLGEDAGSSCKEITGKGVAVGFFPGMLVGVGLLFLYTKMVEMKTRRRSIKSFGPASYPHLQEPEDLLDDLSEKNVPIQQPWNNNGSASPGSSAFSPNLGPVIEPARDRSKSNLGMHSTSGGRSSWRSSAQETNRDVSPGGLGRRPPSPDVSAVGSSTVGRTNYDLTSPVSQVASTAPRQSAELEDPFRDHEPANKFVLGPVQNPFLSHDDPYGSRR